MREISKRRRVQRGVPRGGQFAPERHDEVQIDLLVDQMGYRQLDPEEALRIATQSANKRSQRSQRLDPEELSQETLLYYLNARRNARAKLWDAYKNGRVVVPGTVLQNPGAYINRVTDGIVQRMLTGEDQTPDRSAVKMFRESVKETEQHLKRGLTDAEKDAIAEEIRAEQPAGRRAKVGFHRPVIEAPAGNLMHADGSADLGVVDRPVGADGRDLEHGSAAAGDFEAGELGDELLTIMSAGKEGAVRNARRRAWDAIAGRYGAPLVAPDAVSEVQATKARRAIANGGGVLAVAGRWHSKTATAEESNAMFAPFTPPGGSLNFAQQERVVSSLHRLGDYADDMYDSALAAATKRREKTPKASPVAAGLGSPELRSA